MTQVISSGIVDASRWTYVATAISESLNEALDKPQISRKAIPTGVFYDACRFFDMVEEAFKPDDIPKNPVASAANYSIATKAVRKSDTGIKQTRDAINDKLRRYINFFREIGKNDIELNEENSRLVQEISSFFHKIAREGQTDVYKRFMYDGFGIY